MKKIFSGFILAIMLLSILPMAVIPVYAASVTPTTISPWSNLGWELPYAAGFDHTYKFEPWNEGVTNYFSETIEGNTITITSDNGYCFNWISTYPISAVIVKAGTKAYVYEYDPAVTSDTLLCAPDAKGISHVRFCWNTSEDPEDPELYAFKFYDANLNGQWDENEPAVQGFLMELLDDTGAVIAADLTDENGKVIFTVTGTGPYTIREVLPPNWINTTSTSQLIELSLQMYASAYTAGDVVAVNFDPYNSAKHPARLDPANVLGPFDAVQSPPTPDPTFNPNEYFFGLAARTWTNYVFEYDFWNVNGVPDIEFAEVTWGDWHVEGAKVYLTNAYVRNSGGEIVPYGATDDGIGYYAGIVWNKIGITNLTPLQRLTITQSYFSGTRNFESNTFRTDGNFGISEFYLPDEVVYATGITLVDITSNVYNTDGSANTYTNVAGAGARVTLLSLDPLTVNAVYGYEGNTDGYDLDAIRVYRLPAAEFGNVCIKQGTGGKTIGFWSNKNGQALINSTDVAVLNALNLYTPPGWTYPDFSSTLSTAKTQIKNYILSANAVEMKWMLSAQLIATTLNVQHGLLSNSTIVYVDGGFITIGDILENANAALLGSDRSDQEYWKNLLDGLNNNWLYFVCPGPCYPIVYP